ncbi:GNAT family N-acetyltransferase [Kumtagia ephedrae]|uniref:GNAT family N-acetyltransferase n=1 Tax=Kumtagia ephedrae TaxID=2116701 RepID=A0A2P7RVG1_9HYPH|nr:GNAT family N-acetyltransferase [Mesorhizobium ephedrae]PSJ54214.1 GNAT family N-acetyltransferase [Mesorhizobium ephedrae]
MTVMVREPRAEDRDAFLAMWEDFVALAPSEPGNHAMGPLNWERIMGTEHALQCLLAADADDRPRAFVLFLAFPFTWSRGDVCYLQDIYVCPEARGRGMAQALIARVAEIGRARGWFKIFWMTQSDNFAAQRLYDKVAERKDYIRYDLNLRAP